MQTLFLHGNPEQSKPGEHRIPQEYFNHDGGASMEKKSEFNPQSIQQAAALANSEAGQQLLSALNSKHSKEMEKAFALAASGDYTALKKALDGIISTPETKALLDRLRG